MGLIDEIRDHEEKPLNEVVLPWDFKIRGLSVARLIEKEGERKTKRCA
jgi:hypothetical protein